MEGGERLGAGNCPLVVTLESSVGTEDLFIIPHKMKVVKFGVNRITRHHASHLSLMVMDGKVLAIAAAYIYD